MDRRATFVLTEAARSFGLDVSDMNINRSSIQRHRQQQCTQVARCLKSEFASGIPLTVHWDGKLMEDLTGKQHVDRLPVLVFGVGIVQLFGVPNTTGTGRDQARCVVEVLTEWNITDLVVALASDSGHDKCQHRSSLGCMCSQ